MKLVVVMRGVPGSGKSTLAYIIARGCMVAPISPKEAERIGTMSSPRSYGVICSADDYFLDYEGSYIWNPIFVPVAHAECRAKVTDAMTKSEPLIIVDNTHIKRWMFKYIYTLAEKFGYMVWECTFTPDPAMAETYASRNVHGVSLESIQRYIRNWEE